METSNPVLKSKAFENAQVMGGEQTMTIQGTINKTLILFVILLVTASWTWGKASEGSSVALIGMGGLIVGFILALVSTFKPAWTPVTAPLYAACQGLVLGFVSAIYEAKYPGIAINAVGLTLGVLFAMLMGYKAGFLQATPGLQKGLIIAMIGLMAFYAVVWIASMFGVTPPAFINGSGPMAIGFSLVVVGIASLCLILDFNRIESAAEQRLAKYMEWYCAFSLMVTLVWLYMEILRLLGKMRR